MTKIEDYQAKQAESAAALEAATNERDRQHHRRAVGVYRKLIAGVGEAEARAAAKPEAKLKPLKGATAFR